MPLALTIEDLSSYVGQEIGRSGWLRIDQARIDAFADCTEDHQWIHVDREKAASGPFGTTVAHGFLILALIPRLSREVPFDPEGVVMNINYGLNRVRFIRPVPADAEIRDILVLKEVVAKGRGRILMTIQHTLHIRGQDDPACVAETLRMCMTDVSRRP
jgi:acyl dehydratase